MAQKIYADIQHIKEAINEVGTTDQSVIDTLEQAAKRASAQIESEFVFLVSDEVPFDDPVPEFLEELANQLTEAYFWELQNGNKDLVETALLRIKEQRDRRFNQVPSIIRGNPV